MSLTSHAPSRKALRHWIAGDGYTHALTLNAERELSLRRIGSIFGTFCHRFDKAVLGSRNVRAMPSNLRLRAIAFAEHLETNAHLHVSADLSAAFARLSERQVREAIRCVWLQANRGAGSVHIEQIVGGGWSDYQTKDFRGDYFLSSDFFPH